MYYTASVVMVVGSTMGGWIPLMTVLSTTVADSLIRYFLPTASIGFSSARSKMEPPARIWELSFSRPLDHSLNHLRL